MPPRELEVRGAVTAALSTPKVVLFHLNTQNVLKAPTMEIFLVEILSVATNTFPFFTPPEVAQTFGLRSPICHLFNLVIYLVLLSTICS